MLTVINYTIYHSPNSYLGVLLADRELAGLPVRVERKPIFIPPERGVKVADLIGSQEPPRKGAYHREDCARWAQHYGIEMHFLAPGVFEERATRWRQSPFGREELPARAYYAAVGTGRERDFDRALFRAAWVDGRDVNEESVIADAARSVGLDAGTLLKQALGEDVGHTARAALTAFDHDAAPGVPTWVVAGKRFWGKDRVEWMVREVKRLLATTLG
ncbi:MAG TPA: DsbA family protein [Candidatus Binatia bacterium]|nr:DsbA family protein [Candidatus Binatia bacterium]